MELLEIDGVHFQMLKTGFSGPQNIFIREHFFDTDARFRRPLLVQRRDLGGDVDSFFRFARHAADQLLAVAIAICQRGVDEVDSEIDSAVQGADRLIVGPTLP